MTDSDSSSDSEEENVDLNRDDQDSDRDGDENGAIRRRKSRSAVWKYFTRLENYEAQCNKCSDVFSTPGGTTTTLHRHIKNSDCYNTNAGKCLL